MVVKTLSDVPAQGVEGYDRIEKRVVIGQDDGSQEIVLRYFSIGVGGMSPHHSHDFPHLVKIEAGNGAVLDAMGNERHLQKGDYVYIPDNEVHHFINTGSEPFDFICIVPKRGEG
ncbi:MAG: cupin domain-containing protein [Deltaproteobacteria bacterium]|nr:cupin domain-containing protein [Deltaproteobacteria bacterium]